MNGGFQFLNPAALFLLWIPVLILFAEMYGAFRRGETASRFFSGGKVAGNQKKAFLRKGFVRSLLLTAGALSCTIALARPSWGMHESTVQRKGRDVVFVIDVSRSMLADDLYPNRLERAKLSILDALKTIDGDRVALVAFAGTAVIKCPLTLDYGFFRQSVEELTADSVSRGGSLIGDALRDSAQRVLGGGNGGFQDVILITDGEDQESYPVKAAEMLGERKIRLIAIGLGDENQGRRIPVTDDKGNTAFLTYKGQEVWSSRNAGTLRQMAERTPGGRYLNVATGTFDLGSIYAALIGTQEQKAQQEETDIQLEERFQYFLLLGLLLILFASVYSRRKAGRRQG